MAFMFWTKGQLETNQKVIVDVGTGYYIEKVSVPQLSVGELRAHASP